MGKWRMPPGLHPFRLHLGAFDYSVWVVFSADLAAVARFARRELEDDQLTADRFRGRRGCCLHRGDRCPILWMPRRPRTATEYATLAHEALHVAAHVMRWANIPFTDETEEAYTHTMAAIVRGALVHRG